MYTVQKNKWKPSYTCIQIVSLFGRYAYGIVFRVVWVYTSTSLQI